MIGLVPLSARAVPRRSMSGSFKTGPVSRTYRLNLDDSQNEEG